ncbi:MAG: ATP-binding protein [Syntrophorhabdales bacterium]
MRKVFAITSNVERFIGGMENLQRRDMGVPGMALLYGDPGLGKTRTSVWWALRNDGVFIRTKKIMTPRWLLEEIVAELGEAPMFRTADLFRQIQDKLMDRSRTIIVDEIDYFDGRMIETLRDIHDISGTPVVLIGMAQAEKKLMRYKHLFDRFAEVIRFSDLTLKDVATIAEQLCEVGLTKDAVSFIHADTTRFRRLIVWLYRAEMFANANGRKEVTAADLEKVKR